MKQRIITALFLIIGLIITLFVLPDTLIPWIFIILFISIWEWVRITAIHHSTAIIFTLTTVGLCLVALYSSIVLNILLILSIIHYFYAIIHISRFESIINYRISTTYLTCFGPIVLATLAACLINIHSLVPQQYFFNGTYALIYIILIVAAADSGAYFSGKFLGKHKLAPKVSPKKTIEGLVGGMICVAICAILFRGLLNDFHIPIWQLIIIAILSAGFSIIGDLYISIIKRQNNIKDSSQILPGHGGVLDRIDGLLAAVPVYYFLIIPS